MMGGLYILVMAFLQNISFTMISRARNRDNFWYHLVTGIISNSVWYFTMKALIAANMTWALFIPYTTGTVSGSLTGSKISMRIERWLGATSDAHVQETFFIVVGPAAVLCPNGQMAHGPFKNEAEAVQAFRRMFSAPMSDVEQSACIVFKGNVVPLMVQAA